MEKRKRYNAGAYVNDKWHTASILAYNIEEAKIRAKKEIAEKADVPESRLDRFTCFHVTKGVR